MSILWDVKTFDSLPNTQDFITNRAVDEGALEGRVAHALVQGAGRGRHGREWVSQEGNLFFSFLLRPSCGFNEIGQLALVIGVAIGRALQKYLDRPDILRLKWPNDILLEGQKCAGILIETQGAKGGALDWVCVGIGVNVEVAPDDQAACLKEYSAQLIILDELRDDILTEVSKQYMLWREDGFEEVSSVWLDMAHEKGALAKVCIGENVIQGLFAGIDGQGAMLLHDTQSNELRTITAGDVYLEDAYAAGN